MSGARHIADDLSQGTSEPARDQAASASVRAAARKTKWRYDADNASIAATGSTASSDAWCIAAIRGAHGEAGP